MRGRPPMGKAGVATIGDLWPRTANATVGEILRLNVPVLAVPGQGLGEFQARP